MRTSSPCFNLAKKLGNPWRGWDSMASTRGLASSGGRVLARGAATLEPAQVMNRAAARWNRCVFTSHTKPEQHHVAVAHHVVAAFDAVVASLARMAHGALFDQVLPVHRLGFDETALEIGVHGPGGFHGGCTGGDGPGADLFVVERKEGPEPKDMIGAVDQRVGAGFLHAQLL